MSETWQDANELMDGAAATLLNYNGLMCASLDETRLMEAILILRLHGLKCYEKALQIVERLCHEEQELFWKAQERNINAKRFEDLITKEQYELDMRRANGVLRDL